MCLPRLILGEGGRCFEIHSSNAENRSSQHRPFRGSCSSISSSRSGMICRIRIWKWLRQLKHRSSLKPSSMWSHLSRPRRPSFRRVVTRNRNSRQRTGHGSGISLPATKNSEEMSPGRQNAWIESLGAKVGWRTDACFGGARHGSDWVAPKALPTFVPGEWIQAAVHINRVFHA